eukprot:gnl/TRDRNA2_/TRDRNA2_71328_c0_seq2.p1 gnl/TRDRNA2_/TRDRNA2_71328_c0~~gnl/TRDRNA2_/TRDRNA2_71328_c0_seq2.p1  ORF type:complete len:130 (-),score=26.28 gnl/TRDRNA2_/TRDRNA2_71328_c0_seq2:160-549(-)
MDSFSTQALVTTAWAFATIGEPAPFLLDLISVLESMGDQDEMLNELNFRMAMQCFAVTGQIVAGFVLLARAKSGWVLSAKEKSYQAFHSLLEACRTANDVDAACRVQDAATQLGLAGLGVVATAHVPGS